MNPLKNKIKKYISEKGNSHILIHSDVLFGFKIKFENKAQFLSQHFNELNDTCLSLDILMPTFNYDFCKGKPFNLKSDKSQVGALSEYFRLKLSSWRSSTPVFCFSGTGYDPSPNIESDKIDPFDDTSQFGFLNNNKGLLMHYGSGLHTTTLIHFVERISGKLFYRYDKIFHGSVIDFVNKKHEIDLIYHVRPKNFSLNYDWDKIENDLIKNRIINKFKDGRSQILIGRIDEIVKFWLDMLHNDTLYFLNDSTKNKVIIKYRELNRPFLITDFE